jgi:hypothetical protein
MGSKDYTRQGWGCSSVEGLCKALFSIHNIAKEKKTGNISDYENH